MNLRACPSCKPVQQPDQIIVLQAVLSASCERREVKNGAYVHEKKFASGLGHYSRLPVEISNKLSSAYCKVSSVSFRGLHNKRAGR